MTASIEQFPVHDGLLQFADVAIVFGPDHGTEEIQFQFPGLTVFNVVEYEADTPTVNGGLITKYIDDPIYRLGHLSTGDPEFVGPQDFVRTAKTLMRIRDSSQLPVLHSQAKKSLREDPAYSTERDLANSPIPLELIACPHFSAMEPDCSGRF